MYKFIIVDDEHLIRKGILKKIEALDLNLEFAGEAEDGEEALELINKVNPNIVLTDMRMPLMDGKMLIKKLLQDFPHIKTIIISGYSDFEYLQEAISSQASDYILKPFNREEIHKALTKAINSIEKELSVNKKFEYIEAENEDVKYIADIKYLSELIVTQDANYDSSFLKSKRTSMLRDCKNYVLLSIYTPEKNSESLYLNLINFPNQPDNSMFITGPADQTICFLLYTFKSVNTHQIIYSVKSELNKISEYLKLMEYTDFYMSVSSISTNLNNLHNAYLETISSLEKRELHSRERTFFYDKTTVNPLDLNWNSIDKLIFFIEAGNIGKVKELLKDFFSELDHSTSLNLLSVKYNCQLIFNRVYDILQGYYDSFNNYSFSSRYERMINYTFDLGTIKKEFEHLLVNITSVFKEKNIYPSDEIIGNIKKYIQKNYKQDISLERISELFFINPSYCSYLFKEKTGENFADYINNMRIDKAKDLLINTDYKVYKIANILGYDNDKYFFRIFKKFTGFTPESFRANHTQVKIKD